jgi:basic amino acid/polyamine antiporter, APA family
VLSTGDGITLIVGLIIGAGIFRTPSLVASNVGSGFEFLLLWLVGGAIALIGALCYAELASTYPHAGGEYFVLRRTFGPFVAFLLAWARLTVLQTGSIALLAFVFADYATPVLGTSAQVAPILAVASVATVTAINALGLREGQLTQRTLTSIVVAGLAAVIVVGLFLSPTAAVAADAVADASITTAAAGNDSNIALALVFVLLTYGGWSEAAYMSAELRDERRGVTRTLVWGVAVVTMIYLLTNAAYLSVLGVDGVAASQAVAVDVLQPFVGRVGATIVALIVMTAALSSANATMITSARGGYAVGSDISPLGALGIWNQGRRNGGTPRHAVLAIGAVSLLLVLIGTATRTGFETMVAYTAPVFWLTLLLMGVALIVLRRREPQVPRPFRVPLYPVVPIVFCLTSAWMLWSSVAYAGRGALLGIAVMLAGIPLYLAGRAHARRNGLVAPAENRGGVS